MLVTDLALRDMEHEADSLVGSLGRLLGRLRGHHPASTKRSFASVGTNGTGPGADRATVSDDTIVAGSVARFPPATAESTGESPFKWRRHPQLRARSDTGRNPDPRSELEMRCEAKAAAVRGLFLARSERLEEARSAFVEAATDPSIDLAALPGFWQLSRRAMLTAALAYEDVGRYRDASALSARVRTKYRPRAVAPMTSHVRRAASGGA